MQSLRVIFPAPIPKEKGYMDYKKGGSGSRPKQLKAE
jgi:hypothetical protein